MGDIKGILGVQTIVPNSALLKCARASMYTERPLSLKYTLHHTRDSRMNYGSSLIKR